MNLKTDLKSKNINYIGFAIGTMGFMLPITFVNAYTFQFYVYTVGLDALLVSIGMFIGLVVFSLGAILSGVISDNMKIGKFGKRRPFLLLSLPGMIFFMILIWMPPNCPDGQTMYWPTAIYLWVVGVGFSGSVAMGFAPYYSMLPEQAPTEKERVKVASIQGLFNIIGVVGGMAVVMVLQSQLSDPLNSKWWQLSGQHILSITPWIGGIITIISTIAIVITFFSTQENYKQDDTEIESTNFKRTNFKKSIEQIFAPTKHINNKNFLWQTIFYNMAFRLCIVVMIPFLTFVLHLKEENYFIFFLLIAPFAISGFFFWQKLISKTGLINGFSISIKLSIGISISGLIFLFNFPKLWIGILLGVIIFGLLVSCLLAGFIFPNPITSALVDEIKVEKSQSEENNQEEDLSGAYFGLNLFSMNISSGIANLILGIIFVGDNAENPQIIIFIFPVIGLIYGIGLFFLQKVKLKNR
ncbi:MFS transporter [Promethearchaeum syntrophicum]|uniref:MFS transporter n=1 Tax=Promethearchaeum syntrophicum TaxID=2594042 RepID=A0A5B9D7R4_9ARCH|nr:MFS transporter [Candidatus Prometheoarchaeum syntrophicum]QEE15045.1 Major Facilitator Superfamily protein [Candidatus Prometheoarchaeum syntrophicum]